MTYPLYTFTSSAPPNAPVVHLAIANGFPPPTYAPALAPLFDRARVVSLLPRPLWTPPPDPAALRTWRGYADDLRAGLDAHGLADVIAIGHSLGGIVSLIAAARQPRRFRALILLDPVIFAPSFSWVMRLGRLTGQARRSPLVQQAERRKAVFASHDEAFAYWRGKKLFHDWDAAALRRYTDAALMPTPDGAYTLRWSAAWEAQTFATGWGGSWGDLRRLPADLPVLLVRGGRSDALTAAITARVRQRHPAIAIIELPDAGHLFPQAASAATGAALLGWLTERGLL